MCLHCCTLVCLGQFTVYVSLVCKLFSIISTTDELFDEFLHKQCLNSDATAVLTMTPSLGPNLCYRLTEDELSTGGKKNQRVWNGKWYTTVAYRGNLYYKLPQCTVAEPQTALSFQWVCLCMQVVLLTYSVCVCVYSMLVPLVKNVGFLIFVRLMRRNRFGYNLVVNFTSACEFLNTHTQAHTKQTHSDMQTDTCAARSCLSAWVRFKYESQ